jgi:small subunit ribosomal protein S1
MENREHTDEKEHQASHTNTVDEPDYALFEGDEEDELLLMEQFLADPAHDYRKLQYGETIDGVIMRMDRDGVLVDIGGKSEGIVPPREMQSLTEDERAALKVGNEVLVFVIQAEGQDGHAILSIDKARQEKSWRNLESLFQSGETIEAPVINYNKGGVLVNLNGVRGFVPASQIEGITRGSESQKQSDMARMVGRTMTLKIIEINRNRNRLILSERQALQEAREVKKDELLASLSEGDICKGTISSICDFGAFVDIGGTDGLVHLSELSWGRVNHPGEILTVGQEIHVYILSIDNERRRIALSIKRTQEEPWATVSERYHLGQIVEGTITQLAPFGAFARIEEGIEGLIHTSELGEGHVQNPRDVVQEGDVIPIRIIRIDPTRKRMGLSLQLHPESESSDEAASPVDESQTPTADKAPEDGNSEAA